MSETHDGLPVTSYTGRLVGSFESAQPQTGTLTAFLVTTRPSDSKYTIKDGEVSRSISYKLEQVRLIDSETLRETVEAAGVTLLGVNEGMIEVSLFEQETEDE